MPDHELLAARGSNPRSVAHPSLTDAMIAPEPWTQDALCLQTDPEMFFPEKGGSTRAAKKICASCEVTEQCLDYALRNDEQFGIWGGLATRERGRILKGMPRDARPAVPAHVAESLPSLVEQRLTNEAIAERFGVVGATVGKWRRDMGLPSAREMSRRAS